MKFAMTDRLAWLETEMLQCCLVSVVLLDYWCGGPHLLTVTRSAALQDWSCSSTTRKISSQEDLKTRPTSSVVTGQDSYGTPRDNIPVYVSQSVLSVARNNSTRHVDILPS